MIAIKFLHSILFIGFTYIIYLKYNYKLEIKYKYYILLLIFSIALFVINSMYEGLSNKLFLLLLLFSFAQILIHFMKDMIIIRNSNNILNKNLLFREKYIDFKSFIFDKVFIILVLAYQLLLIWFPVIFNQMISE